MEEILLFSMPGGSEWILILLVLAFAFYWIKTLVEIANTKFEDSATKIVWFMPVLFLFVFGAIIYNWFGRPRKLTTNE